MALRDRNLIDDESVVLDLRTHAKVMIGPFALFLALVAAAIAVMLLSSNDVVTWVVLAVAAVVAVGWVFLPWLRWRTTSYAVTTQRVAERRGIVTRVGRDIPLYRINDISIEKDLVDRLLGCGTLVIADATEKPGMVLHDVPRVDAVHRTIQQLLWDQDDGSDDGERPPTEPPRRRS
ncbi:PH domain-containing protein [Xylanimonas ulmi]|uniref:PH (Pleckstrin Homology) domain-containing protein n=1 Tax=Xylanimonas ulmi TaxID=228973 RepID=A0A4Q7M7V6_9MICO|nr:PH domain-containing protein [Xylanibacterium ulmi]RZS62768.1 PH (Pleckstrin Homology) domain-containing protein [Xylanibacterium ulmi]